MAKFINEKNPIYFSYARNSNEKPEWAHIADVVPDLLKTFRKEKIRYSIDTEDVTNSDRISDYEKEIGDAKYLILILSERYFQSPHCMYELVNIMKNSEEKTIFYIKVGKVDINKPKLKTFWEHKQVDIKAKEKYGHNYVPNDLEKAIIENNFFLDFIDSLPDNPFGRKYENADDIKLKFFSRNQNHHRFVAVILKKIGWQPIWDDNEYSTKVQTSDDFEGMETPFVGVIPLHTRKLTFLQIIFTKLRKITRKIFKIRLLDDDYKRPIVVKVGSMSVSTEAFRILRTNIEITNSEREQETEGGEVILVTSMTPGSGKTYITTNLAAAFAIKDRKTIVVDLDLRKGTFSLNVGEPDEDNFDRWIKPEHGVSSFLAGYDDDWHYLVKPLQIPKAVHKYKKHAKHQSRHKETEMSRQMKKKLEEAYLDVLPAGAIPPNPTELLNTDDFKTLIAELKREYDVIILDAPPYDMVADTRIIAREVDSTLYVVRAGTLDHSILPKIDKLYINNQLPYMSILLNAIGKTSYGFGSPFNYISDDVEEIAD